MENGRNVSCGADGGNIDLLEPYMRNEMQLLKRITHNILRNIGANIYDYDDFYSDANMVCWEASKIYDARRNCKFHTLLVNCIKNDFKTLIRDRNRKKRILNYTAYSLDYIQDTDDNFDSKLVDYEKDICDVVIEGQELSADMIRMKVPIITDLQVNILEYLKAGYKAGEIQIILDISQYEYYKNIKKINQNKMLFKNE